jgi:phage tail sheath gpL-like
MADQDILSRIHELVDEEHQLRDADDTDTARLRELEEQLDQCWDLLRQRRAKREFGQSESEAEVRSTDTVERYQG